jgi:lysozyme
MDRNALLADLENDEGYRIEPYDDATGKSILPGSSVKGNVTLLFGWCPAKHPLSLDRAKVVLGWLADDVTELLVEVLPWINTLSDARQRALTNMAYNLGVSGLLKFDQFLSLLQQDKCEEAADDLATSVWFSQVGDRAKRIQTLIRNG